MTPCFPLFTGAFVSLYSTAKRVTAVPCRSKYTPVASPWTSSAVLQAGGERGQVEQQEGRVTARRNNRYLPMRRVWVHLKAV